MDYPKDNYNSNCTLQSHLSSSSDPLPWKTKWQFQKKKTPETRFGQTTISIPFKVIDHELTNAHK